MICLQLLYENKRNNHLEQKLTDGAEDKLKGFDILLQHLEIL